MKIYFAVPVISGDRKGLPLRQIREFLEKEGHYILTQHLLEEDCKEKESRLPRNFIFQRDTSWLEEADLVLAEVSFPSTGIGYEIAHALSLKKEVLCLAQEKAPVSAMIEGNDRVVFFRYRDPQEALSFLADFLKRPKTSRKKSPERKTRSIKKGKREA